MPLAVEYDFASRRDALYLESFRRNIPLGRVRRLSVDEIQMKDQIGEGLAVTEKDLLTVVPKRPRGTVNGTNLNSSSEDNSIERRTLLRIPREFPDS